MELSAAQAARIAQNYIGESSPLTRLGWGISGFVYASRYFSSAIKVFKSAQGFAAELRAYELLRSHRIDSFMGLTIPVMHRFDRQCRIIEMDLVAPPFLLDFAGVHFEKPDFSDEVWAAWHDDIELRFGQNKHFVYAVYHFLMGLGMWYVDFRPSNLNVTGHPDAALNPFPDDRPGD